VIEAWQKEPQKRQSTGLFTLSSGLDKLRVHHGEVLAKSHPKSACSFLILIKLKRPETKWVNSHNLKIQIVFMNIVIDSHQSVLTRKNNPPATDRQQK
jgi:hypothetical protein